MLILIRIFWFLSYNCQNATELTILKIWKLFYLLLNMSVPSKEPCPTSYPWACFSTFFSFLTKCYYESLEKKVLFCMSKNFCTGAALQANVQSTTNLLLALQILCLTACGGQQTMTTGKDLAVSLLTGLLRWVRSQSPYSAMVQMNSGQPWGSHQFCMRPSSSKWDRGRKNSSATSQHASSHITCPPLRLSSALLAHRRATEAQIYNTDHYKKT